jgi:3-hydroxyacyl-CoA dehydrogenase
MTGDFRSAAVLGAGTMGAQIAAHLANAGLPVVLLDQSVETARQGLRRLDSLRPGPFFGPDAAGRIQTGGFDDLALAARSDWIVEAVVEDLAVKRALLARLEAHRAPGAVVSSNTSGIPLGELAAGRSDGFRRHWLGTHFFNPPRYLPLVELIATPDTEPDVVSRMAAFLDRRLGKGVVLARDTPGFIANRLGLFSAARALAALEAGAFTVEEIDAITGPILGRPKSATFRTLDIAGLDIVANVAADLGRRLPAGEGREFALPALVDTLIRAGAIGVKAGRGFYRREPRDGESEILTVDLAAAASAAGQPGSSPPLSYRPLQSPRLPSLEAARAATDTGARIRRLFLADDRVGAFLRGTLGATLLYAARVAPEIANSIDDVDRAMRWGMGWEIGPFETWDAIGARAVLDACRIADPPRLVRDMLAQGRDRFRDAPLAPAGAGLLILQTAKAASGVVRRNAAASLVDLGDGVLAVEFHSKMNVIGGDTLEMLEGGVREAAMNFAALVVGSEADVFSAGANLMLLLLEAQDGNWDEIDLMVRAFQRTTMALKHAPVPVIAAPAGLALGGGCEVCLHADRVQAAAETYLGLVEVGVGLIPAGGGTKEMLLRAIDRAGGTDPSNDVQRTFETIGLGTVSTSADDARRLGYLRDLDGVTMNRERVIADAKARALARAAEGYQPPARRTAVPVGGAGTLATLSLGVHLAWRAGRISDHDARIGRKLAWVLAGGDLPHRTTVSEDYLLDLEREAFLSLCGEPKTLERIAYTLKTGKTLRN